jgi:diacylglycerol diphosphate phosphatase / phosphatidate phosphatase
MWKMIAVYAPILGATLIAGALTIDEYHNWYDCLAGAIIGTVMAFSAYRMVYASVWDFRFNHIPLMRHMPFSYGAGALGAGGFEETVFTRQAGWGHEDGAIGGAPFDAAQGLRGGGFGSSTGGVGNGISSGVVTGNGVHHDNMATKHHHEPMMTHGEEHHNGLRTNNGVGSTSGTHGDGIV